jgi:DNA-binding CsgD family transcriptional regulator
MNNTVWIYSGVLTATFILLQLFEYYLAIKIFPAPVYIGFIVILFTTLVIWLGMKFMAKPKNESTESEFRRNQQAIESLEINEQELEVLDLLAEGKSNQEIANNLFLSINNVQNHLSSLYKRLEVSRRSMAIKKARNLRLIP